MKTLIKNASIVNEGRTFRGHLLINNDRIDEIFESDFPAALETSCHVINAEGQFLLPGVIDDQVHFREPGLTHKAEIYTEAKAAIAGGTTSFMEMPNTIPQTVTQEELEKKFARASDVSLANYSFFIGATNTNIEQVLATDPKHVCGVKIFMGSSTGDMLVDQTETLDEIFRRSKMLIATHCEDEATIRANSAAFRAKFGEHVPISAHPIIRSEDACYLSSSKAVAMAKKHGTRLHVLHISTAKETSLFSNDLPLDQKRITAEACIHHLWFSDQDYPSMGARIKWNPAVKSEADRNGVWRALLDNRIDIVATDHAPHTMQEKAGTYWSAPSGGPLVQHALVAMFDFIKNGKITIERAVEKMCHAPAICFQIHQRGFLRKGYYADLVLVDPNQNTVVSKETLLYKCGWSPFEGHTFSAAVKMTFVNGRLVYNNGVFNEQVRGAALTFDR